VIAAVAAAVTYPIDADDGKELFYDGVSVLDSRFQDLEAALLDHLSDLHPERVYPNGYPDITRDSSGIFCDADIESPETSLPGTLDSET